MQGISFFFWPSPEFGAKFWNEIELLSLSKLCKNISSPRSLLNQQKINAYVANQSLLSLIFDLY